MTPCGAASLSGSRDPMTHPDALARLHWIAGTHVGHSDPYIRAILPPVPLEWATPAERQEWRSAGVAHSIGTGVGSGDPVEAGEGVGVGHRITRAA